MVMFFYNFDNFLVKCGPIRSKSSPNLDPGRRNLPPGRLKTQFQPNVVKNCPS